MTRLRLTAAAAAIAAAAATWYLRRPPADVRATYRVVYRGEDLLGTAPAVSTEILVVQRPWRLRREQRSGPPPGRALRVGTVLNETWAWTLSADAEAGYRRAPGRLSEDPSVAALEAAVRHGSAERGGARTVAGQRCRSYFVREPPPRALTPPDADSRYQLCVTGDGVPLADEWTVSGRPARRRTAVSVLRHAVVPASTFFVGRRPDRTEAENLIAANQVVRDDPPVDPARLKIDLPAGYRLVRRAAVTERGGAPRSAYVEAFDGPDGLVVVEQGTSASGPPWNQEEGRRIELPRVGPVRIVSFAASVEARALGGVGFVRVQAPSEALALRFARGLRIG